MCRQLQSEQSVRIARIARNWNWCNRNNHMKPMKRFNLVKNTYIIRGRFVHHIHTLTFIGPLLTSTTYLHNVATISRTNANVRVTEPPIRNCSIVSGYGRTNKPQHWHYRTRDSHTPSSAFNYVLATVAWRVQNKPSKWTCAVHELFNKNVHAFLLALPLIVFFLCVCSVQSEADNDCNGVQYLQQKLFGPTWNEIKMPTFI